MTRRDSDHEDGTNYKVISNQEEQYSIWPEDNDLPLGWHLVGKSGSKTDCLTYVNAAWKDMRPLSLQKHIDETPRNARETTVIVDAEIRKSLVDRLSEGNHRVEVILHPEKSMSVFRAAVARNHVHIKFPETRGGTQLSFELDKAACSFDKGDLDSGNGTVHLEGLLTLDYTKVRCVADVDLHTLDGTGRLIRLQAASAAV
jgi:uncharacterized protein YbdZ (MbtH family)